MYKILVLDYNECCCAEVYSDAEINILFKDTSLVPRKQDAGGQSAKRYQQNRQNAIVDWFKQIDDMLKNVQGDIIVGISSIYYNKFYSLLSTYNKQKIKEQLGSEYSDLSGIYQMVTTLERRKQALSI